MITAFRHVSRFRICGCHCSFLLLFLVAPSIEFHGGSVGTLFGFLDIGTTGRQKWHCLSSGRDSSTNGLAYATLVPAVPLLPALSAASAAGAAVATAPGAAVAAGPVVAAAVGAPTDCLTSAPLWETYRTKTKPDISLRDLTYELTKQQETCNT